MLQAFRTKSGKIFIKVLFIFLIISLGAFGISDMLRTWGGDGGVISVGPTEITADEIRTVVQRAVNALSRNPSTHIDLATAKQLGILDESISQIVTSDLLDLEADRLGISVPDQLLRDNLMAAAAFKGPDGKFDPERYRQLLQANGFAPQRFEAEQRVEFARQTLVDAVLGGLTPPKLTADALVAARGEHRGGTAVFLAYSAATGIALPDEAATKAFYDSHPDAFQTPEYRAATILAVTGADATADLNVPDDKLRADYEARRDSFTTPEKREIQQLLAADEKIATHAAEELRAGKPAEEVAKDVPGQDAGSVALGLLQKSDLPPELAAVAFSLPEGGVSAPVHTALGWHVLRATRVVPSTTQDFEAARASLAADARREAAGDRLDKLDTRIGDALAGGAALDTIAKNNGLKTIKITAIDKIGHDPQGKNVSLPFDGILPLIFATKPGDTSPLQTAATGDGGLFVLHVDAVTPPARRPLDAVKDEVVQAVIRDRQQAAVKKQAAELVAAASAASAGTATHAPVLPAPPSQVAPPQAPTSEAAPAPAAAVAAPTPAAVAERPASARSLASIAAEHGLVPVTIAPAARNGQANGGAMPSSVVQQLFNDKPDQISSVETADGVYVVQLTSVQPGDPTKDLELTGQVTNDLRSSLFRDGLSQYGTALRQRFPVRIDRAAIDRLF